MNYGEIWWIISKLIQNTVLMLLNVKVFIPKGLPTFPVRIQCHGTVCRCREVAAGRWYWSHQVLRWSCGNCRLGLVCLYLCRRSRQLYRCMLFTMGWVCGRGSPCLCKGQIPLDLGMAVFLSLRAWYSKRTGRLAAQFRREDSYLDNILIYIGLCWFILIYVDLCWFMLIYVDLCWFILIHVDLCWFMLIYVGLCWFMLIYVDSYWFILMHLVYVDLCWFMLIYVDSFGLCWFILIHLVYPSFWGMRKWILIPHQIRFPFFNHLNCVANFNSNSVQP